MFTSREGEDHVCAKCLKKPPKFGKARSAGLYNGSLRAAIHLLKYRKKTYLAPRLGFVLFQKFIESWAPGEIDLIVPIPLHKRRLRKRGFNQTYQLIRKWPMLLERPTFEDFSVQISQDYLYRNRRTKAQVGMSREERLRNIRGVFSVSGADLIKGKRVLVVDDVFTTGATANECAKTLRKNGAANVDILTLAQTERRLN
jgi:ComF family protein